MDFSREVMSSERQYAQAARAWPFEEARKLVERYKDAPPAKGYVLFETGYGPPACRISAPSARSCAPPWCGAPSSA
jgi:hypothetical protein